jgi:hypothetical protein
MLVRVDDRSHRDLLLSDYLGWFQFKGTRVRISTGGLYSNCSDGRSLAHRDDLTVDFGLLVGGLFAQIPIARLGSAPTSEEGQVFRAAALSRLSQKAQVLTAFENCFGRKVRRQI